VSAGPSSGAVLVTGGTGYLGRRLARRYLRETDLPVVLWVRAEDEGALAERRAALEADLGAAAPRLAVAGGRLEDPEPFEGVDAGAVGTIVHTAADIRFNVDEPTANRVNIGGTEKLLSFAERCPGLGRVGLLSTAYACGLAGGVIEEGPLSDAAGFANHYERSKWACEDMARRRFASLPWRICRVATIVADDESGAVSQYNAVHNTFKLLFYGLASLVPGDADCPMYFITGDFASGASFAAIERGEDRATYHVNHTGAQAVKLGALMDLAYRRFQQDPEFRAKRILPPLLVDQASFDALSGTVQSLSGEVVTQAVSSMAPFSRQLFVPKDFRNDRLAALHEGARDLDARRLMERVVDALVRTRWGRRPLAAPAPAAAGAAPAGGAPAGAGGGAS
jgi:nucleoside-diphosphate-sugar epimerase